MHRIVWATLLLVGVTAFSVATFGAQRQKVSPAPFPGVLDEHPVIQYAQRPARDRVSHLNSALAEARVSLRFQEQGGYLRSVLDALGVASETQVLVFSKTGVQRALTSPQSPRAIFFNDSVVVGFIPGAQFLELATHDPEQGVVFYTLDQSPTPKPEFTRRTDCLRCHVSATTLEVPGLINRSTFARADGSVVGPLGFNLVNHRTALLERWGGMYVTGTYTATPYTGRKEHMGNVTMGGDPATGPTSSNEVFIEWLNSDAATRGYPSHDSDIASLMVFDHQTHAINLLTRLNWETRVAMSDGRADFGGGALRALVDELTDYLLFVDEAPPPARITPRAGFVERFNADARKDRQGRSLRELDLETRLLKYPCSYMVYTDAFESLPAGAKNAVYQRMWAILSGRDRAAKYTHLSASDRRAIVAILRDTKKDLPDIFQSS
jgi:hypothetical protein